MPRTEAPTMGFLHLNHKFAAESIECKDAIVNVLPDIGSMIDSLSQNDKGEILRGNGKNTRHLLRLVDDIVEKASDEGQVEKHLTVAHEDQDEVFSKFKLDIYYLARLTIVNQLWAKSSDKELQNHFRAGRGNMHHEVFTLVNNDPQVKEKRLAERKKQTVQPSVEEITIRETAKAVALAIREEDARKLADKDDAAELVALRKENAALKKAAKK